MALIRDEDKNYLSEEFKKYVTNDVDIVLFTTTKQECKYCKETIELASEVSELSDKIHLVKYTMEDNKEEATKFKVEKAPTTIVTKHGSTDGRVRYSGLPSGYEFGSLIEDLKNVSKWEADISSKALEIIKKIDKPVTIKVFVTPTCPYCPKAVGTAHKFAILNENITGEMVESLEFEAEAEQAGVSSVPHILINGEVEFVGAYPDDQFAEYVLEAYNHA
ncbi:MAG: thioredoxin family protein [Candidatus Thermoplasmatota archaeon]|nr:thioredoxin family protein [Candidatus Thermoplasmatota archaeon]